MGLPLPGPDFRSAVTQQPRARRRDAHALESGPGGAGVVVGELGEGEEKGVPGGGAGPSSPF